jgi:hypothetical protein
MTDLLHRAWHHPVYGPAILIAVGLPVFVGAIILLVVVPFFVGADTIRAVISGTPSRLSGLHPVVLWGSVAAWTGIAGYAALAARMGAINRAAMREATVVLNGPVTAKTAAGRLRKAVIAAGIAGVEVSGLIEEDYGHGFWVSRGQDRFWVAVCEAGVDTVVVSASYDAGFGLWQRISHRADASLHGEIWTVVTSALATMGRVVA